MPIYAISGIEFILPCHYYIREEVIHVCRSHIAYVWRMSRQAEG